MEPVLLVYNCVVSGPSRYGEHDGANLSSRPVGSDELTGIPLMRASRTGGKLALRARLGVRLCKNSNVRPNQADFNEPPAAELLFVLAQRFCEFWRNGHYSQFLKVFDRSGAQREVWGARNLRPHYLRNQT